VAHVSEFLGQLGQLRCAQCRWAVWNGHLSANVSPFGLQIKLIRAPHSRAQKSPRRAHCACWGSPLNLNPNLTLNLQTKRED
jgi:hypothetical protein